MVFSLWNPTHRLTAIAMLISFITVVPGSDNVTGHDADFLRWLPEVLDVLCPYSRTCRGGEPRLQLDEGMESCCTECSCEDSCGLTESCCYPEQAVKSYFDRSYQQCEYPSTARGPGVSMSAIYFYMVTRGNGNEHEEDCGTANATCGENETASVLGSLYPVSSKTTGVIYKNEQCARCHGVARSDMMHWKVVMTCPSVKKGRMDTYLKSLENGRVPGDCFLNFYYPGPQYLANVHRCYEHTKRICWQYGYRVPSYLNMTDDEVRTACLSGPKAQYSIFYNPFCYMCLGRLFIKEDQCVKPDQGVRDILPGGFSTLLSSNFLEKKSFAERTKIETRVQIPLACKRQNEAHINVDDCRPALCPSGKVRRGTACVYQTETLSIRIVNVAIQLYAGDNRNVYPLVDHLTSHLQQGKDWRALISAPGLGSWRLSVLCYPDETQQAIDSGLADFFWLRLTLEQKTPSSFSKLLASVNKFMTEDWNFLFNMTSVPIKRKLSGIVNALRYKSKYNIDPAIIPTASFLNWLDFSCTGLTVLDPLISITKVFFCEQVALQPGEYIMYKGSKALYVNATGRVLTPVEYSLRYDANGEPVPRLCLKDTDYVLVPQQYSASPSAINPSLFAVVVIAKIV